MDLNSILQTILNWVDLYLIRIISTVIVVTLYALLTRIALPKIEHSVNEGRFKSESADKAYRIVRFISGLIAATTLLLVWGFNFSGLLILSTSLITLTGVALFASWSLLSNITAYMVLLSHASFKRGNFLRVIDGDNYVEGYIADIGPFNTKLITEDREVIMYPNNLILTRPTVINSRMRMNSVGKITAKESDKVNAS